jgi:hypothetical protein
MMIFRVAVLFHLELTMEQLILQITARWSFQAILSKLPKYRKWNSYPSACQIAPLLLEGRYCDLDRMRRMSFCFLVGGTIG